MQVESKNNRRKALSESGYRRVDHDWVCHPHGVGEHDVLISELLNGSRAERLDSLVGGDPLKRTAERRSKTQRCVNPCIPAKARHVAGALQSLGRRHPGVAQAV